MAGQSRRLRRARSRRALHHQHHRLILRHRRPAALRNGEPARAARDERAARNLDRRRHRRNARSAWCATASPIALRIARASDEGRRARWGELYCARVREIDQAPPRRLSRSRPPRSARLLAARRRRPRRACAASASRCTKAQGVIVSVTREAARGKNPVVELSETGHDGEAPHRMAATKATTNSCSPNPPTPHIRAKLDALIEDALARTAPIPGGGVLTIEPTAALVAIDVDAGGRAKARGDPERFALDLNIAAAHEAARQIRLRNLAGIIAIDFVSHAGQVAPQAIGGRRARSVRRRSLERAVRRALALRRVRSRARATAHAAARTDARRRWPPQRRNRGADGAARHRTRSPRRKPAARSPARSRPK